MSDKYEADFSESTSQPEVGFDDTAISENSEVETSVAPGVEAKPKRGFRWSRNRFFALGAVVLLLGGGGAWAYNAYQSPTTVIGMAIGSLFGQKNAAYDVTVKTVGNGVQGLKGSLNMAISSGDVGSDLKALLSIDLGGQNIGATVEAVSAKSGDAYLSLSKFDTLLTLVKALGVLPATADLSSIEGKWIKVSKAEIDQLTGSTGGAATCLQDKFKDSAHAAAVSSELIDLAKAHEFMVVSKELGTKDGKVGFEMAFDVPQLKAFLTGALGTKAFADYTECTGVASSLPSKAEMEKSINSISASDIENAMKNLRISLWADQFSHKLSKLSVVDTQPSTSFEMDLEPVAERTVEIPADSMSLAELQNTLASLASTVQLH